MQGVFASVGWVQKVEFRGLLLQLRVLLRCYVYTLGVDVLCCGFYLFIYFFFFSKFYQVFIGWGWVMHARGVCKCWLGTKSRI